MDRSHNPITPQSELSIDELPISVRDGHQITIRQYRHKENHGSLPLFIYMHGGGFVTGGLETDDSTCRAIASHIPVVVINVEYRLAPENKFPIGFEDCFDVLRWVHLP